MACSSVQKASGVSADTNNLPSCPGLICDATIPVSSYATPAITLAFHESPSDRQKRYVNQPVSTKWIAMPSVMATSTGMIQRSHAVG